jgi:2-polyprenyl-3-methyl-5-hydroxy-6-metoxy-1,4-benzoquinol methylase
MSAAIDTLTSATLKHLREDWWDDDFTEFLAETLKPRPGNRILDVGCGEGLAEIAIGRLHISQIRLFGVDLAVRKVIEARQATLDHNQRVGFAAADACRLCFTDAAFDSLYCVAVLQHIAEVEAAVAEFARVTRAGGRVVAVEPDNTARYWFSQSPAGQRVFEASRRFFAALTAERRDRTDSSVGPKLPALFARHGIEPLDVRLFPVSHAWLGAPPEDVWADRRSTIDRLSAEGPPRVRALWREYLDALNAYEAEARQAGDSFVEIQNTMLFATVGQKPL